MWCGGGGAGDVGSSGRFSSYSCLFNDAVSNLGYREHSYLRAVKEDWKDCARKCSWTNLKYCPCIHKHTVNLLHAIYCNFMFVYAGQLQGKRVTLNF